MSRVILGDCLEEMRKFPDNHFDLVLTDPPYGLEPNNMRNAVGHMDVSWDKLPASDEMIAECIRVSKQQIIWGGNYFNLPPTRCFIVWDKGETMKGRSWAECELAWTSFDEVARINKVTYRELKQHPTQKPLRLMRWCLTKYAKEGWTVLDPFMGSGTTLRAAKDLGFECTGIEINPEYVKIAEQRLKQEVLL